MIATTEMNPVVAPWFYLNKSLVNIPDLFNNRNLTNLSAFVKYFRMTL